MPAKLTQKGQALIALIILVLLIGSTFMIGGFTKPDQERIGDAFTGTITGAPEPTDGQNLQLKTFSFIIPSPTPVPTDTPQTTCNHDNGIPAEINDGQPVPNPSCSCSAYLVECHLKKCINILNSGATPVPGTTTPCGDPLAADPGNVMYGGGRENNIEWQGNIDGWCDNPNLVGDAGEGTFCLGKPVIYLYPTTPTLVDVKVETSGKIVISDPYYPTGGWKKVLASPDGKLVYKGSNYKELFYESKVSDFAKPTNGIIIPISNLTEGLRKNLYKLGLNDSESKEFIEFWQPKLKGLNSKYILFSVIEKSAKEEVDKVIINPEPNTRIEFIVYFRPLNKVINVEPLILPSRPERIGFTAVEWGGVIDNNSKLE
ncbi:MAG TPA: hypothetical protein VG917_05025 [Patescibacteria group bacterium]|nr:hypothetical protein [Patescibacteria group bacterium]